MTEQKPGVIWLVCPKCKSRYEVRAAVVPQHLRCKQCRTELRAVQVADADDLLGDVNVEMDLPAAASTSAPIYKENVLDVVKHAEPPPLPSQRRLRPEPERKAEIDEEYRAPTFRQLPISAILWAFTSNIFTFPFKTCSLLPWITITLVGAAAGTLALGVYIGITSGERMTVVLAGFFVLPTFYASFFGTAYAAACMDSILVNAAYQMDDAQDWPDPDHRERVYYLLRWGYVLTIVVLTAAGVSVLTDLAWQVSWQVFWPIVAFLFPIALLSTLETASMSPISFPVWRSVLRLPHVWFLYYAMCGLIAYGCFWLAKFAFPRLGLLTPLAVSPVIAAGVLIYARLLGRLAWCVLSSGNAQNVGERGKRVHYGTPD